MRIIIGITGASGVVYAVRLLETLSNMKSVEVHLVASRTAEKILKLEMGLGMDELKKLADYTYDIEDLTAPISSGSFHFDSAIIIPCSMKTLAGIASGYSENLLLRVADIALKMKRKLVLVVREAPYNIIHLKNMLKVAEAGGIIMPASPAFYHKPESIDELVNYVVGRVLEIIGVTHNLYPAWSGLTE